MSATLSSIARPVVQSSLQRATGILDTPVRDFMRPGVVALPEDASVRTAQRAMLANHAPAILVIGRMSGRPLGWVTERNMLPYLDVEPALMQIGGLVTGTVQTIGPSATAAEAAIALARWPGAPLLVMRRGGSMPEGTVTERDLIRLDAGG